MLDKIGYINWWRIIEEEIVGGEIFWWSNWIDLHNWLIFRVEHEKFTTKTVGFIVLVQIIFPVFLQLWPRIVVFIEYSALKAFVCRPQYSLHRFIQLHFTCMSLLRAFTPKGLHVEIPLISAKALDNLNFYRTWKHSISLLWSQIDLHMHENLTLHAAIGTWFIANYYLLDLPPTSVSPN